MSEEIMGHQALLDAITKAGGQRALADLLPGVAGQSAIGNWILRRSTAPIEHCAAIEKGTGISRRDLRPNDWGDIWPELIDDEHPWPVKQAV